MASTRLTRTPSSAGNRRTWTFSAWIKRSKITADQQVFVGDSPRTWIVFPSDDTLQVFVQVDFQLDVKTTMLFRDTSAWYHIVVAVDTTQALQNDRVKIYVNGSLVDVTNSYAVQNYETGVNNTGEHYIGRLNYADSSYFNGSMSHIHLVDGTAYDATAFGEYDANGVWKIKTSPSVTYGTNGFFILKDGNSVTDQSGNSNNWTVASGTLTKTEDSPSNVFATFNPLARNASNTYANGNTTYDYSNNYQKSTVSTLSTNNLKIYSEFKILTNTTKNLGIAGDTFISDGRTVTDTSASHTYDILGHTGTIVLQSQSGLSNIYADGSDTGSDVDFTTTTNDIVMIAFDPTTKKIWFGKNGTWSNSGDPSNGTNPSYTYSGTATSDFCFAVGCEGSSSGGISANFGNGYFGTTAVASAGTNASGNGIFEYDVPTGYTALSTKGLNL